MLLRYQKGFTCLDKIRNEYIRKGLGMSSINDGIRRYRIYKIDLNTWKGWKKDECRSRFFGTGPKEEDNLVNHAEVLIHSGRKRPILELEKKKMTYVCVFRVVSSLQNIEPRFCTNFTKPHARYMSRPFHPP
jgi:hypothetical protein